MAPNPRDLFPPPIPEPERYEFREAPRYEFLPAAVDRRTFLKITGAAGGLLVVAAWPETASAQQGESGRFGGQGRETNDLASWLHIDESGRVTAFTGKVEIGQNIRTSLAQTIGDELRVPLDAVTLVMADTDLTPYDAGTFGSRTTPTMAPILARVGATAREMLIDRAAEQWHVDRTTLAAKAGRIVGRDGHDMDYGALVRGRALVGTVSAAAPEMARTEWSLRGTPARKVGGAEIVTGRHGYTPDIQRPGLLIGRVIRPAAYGATAQSVDDSAARAMTGVTVVRDGAFIGVVAPTERAAKRAAAAIRVDWQMPTGLPTSETVYEHLRQTATTGGGRGGRGGGSAAPPAPAAGDANAYRATFEIPYIAHVPLEPRAAVAEWSSDGRVTVWTGTQRPFGVRTEVAQAFQLTEDRVRVIVPDMGSGYGGKHTGEQAIEAARLARAAGKPVKLVYTRAEEFMWGYFRPAGVIDVSATVSPAGKLTSWTFDNYNSGNAGLASPYVIPSKREQFHQADSPLRQGSYRGLAATANHYAREMHMDAIARALKMDAVDFRLANLDDARVRAVLTAAAKEAGWPRASQAGRALGIACGTEKGSYIATAAEVSHAPWGPAGPDRLPFTVHRLVVVFECGAIVNPNGLKNQVEGAVVQGLGGALFESVQFANGQLENGTMADYRVPRFHDVPRIDVVLLDRRDLPSAGAGETPIVCVAPAIGSALRAFGTVAPKLPVGLA